MITSIRRKEMSTKHWPIQLPKIKYQWGKGAPKNSTKVTQYKMQRSKPQHILYHANHNTHQTPCLFPQSVTIASIWFELVINHVPPIWYYLIQLRRSSVAAQRHRITTTKCFFFVIVDIVVRSYFSGQHTASTTCFTPTQSSIKRN